MPFPPPRDHTIPLASAVAMTRRYRESAGGRPERAVMFPRSAFDAILKQAGVAGIRIYFGIREDGTFNLLLVGVDGNANDLSEGSLFDWGFPCPPVCWEGSLNG